MTWPMFHEESERFCWQVVFSLALWAKNTLVRCPCRPSDVLHVYAQMYTALALELRPRLIHVSTTSAFAFWLSSCVAFDAFGAISFTAVLPTASWPVLCLLDSQFCGRKQL